MLKGVNRQVVDVYEPDSAYFERVLFFVKPEFCGLGESSLRHKADDMLKKSGGTFPAKSKKDRRKKLFGVLKLAAAALSGAVVSAVLMIIN